MVAVTDTPCGPAETSLQNMIDSTSEFKGAAAWLRPDLTVDPDRGSGRSRPHI